MKRFLLSILCCLVCFISGKAETTTVTDELDRDLTGVTVTSYKSWSGKTSNSEAVYAGQSAGGNSSIQLRATNPSGIITTKSGGKVRKVTVVWNSSTKDGRTLDVYGKNSAYSAPTELYDASNQGTKLGTIVKGTSTELDIDGDYEYIGLRSKSDAMYLASITITWEPNLIVVEDPKINFNSDPNFEKEIEVEITKAEGTRVYYTLDGNTPTDESSEYTTPLKIKATATLKAVAYDANDNKSSVVEQKFTLTSSASSGTTKTATLVKDIDDIDVDDQVVVVASTFDYALSTTQNTNNRGSVAVKKDGDNVTLNDDIQILTLEEGANSGQFAFQTGEGYLYAASTSNNHLKTSSTLNNKASFTIEIDNTGVATIKADQTVRNWLRFNSTNNPPIFSCYSSGQANISLYKVNLASIEDYILNVTAAGWATLYLGHAVTIPSGVTCYAISSIEDGELVLDELTDVIPASTGVLVKADEGDYTFKVTEVPDEVVNLLTGTTKNEYITEGGYVLSIVNDEVGLYKAKMNGGVFLNNANKAYLPANAVPASVQGANGFKFRFETTGVEGVQVAQGKKVIFDLSGRKVNDMTAPGVYIVNGKKVLVK